MANRAFLYSSATDAADFQHDNLILEASYSVPLCWLAIAGAEDMRVPSGETGQPVLVIPLAEARRRFAERAPILRKYFTNIEEWLSAWQQMLEIVAGPYLKAQVGEILAMYEEEEHMLTDALDLFAGQTPQALATLLQLTFLRDKYNRSARTLEDDLLPFFLVGGKCAPWLPWTDPDEQDDVDDEIPMIPNPEPILSRVTAQPKAYPAPTTPAAPAKPAPVAKKAWWEVWKK